MIPLHALALVALQVSDGNSSDTTPPTFVGAPAFTPAPNGSTPLSARLVVNASEPVVVEIYATDGARAWRFTPQKRLAQHHDLALVGFHPGHSNVLRVMARDRAGNHAEWPQPFVFVTPQLPPGFPPIHVTVSDPARMEPGLTLTAMRFTSSTLPGSGTYLAYFDAAGKVVWLHATSEDVSYSAIRLRNGNLFFIVGHHLAREMDLLGNTVAEWWAARQTTSGMPAGAIQIDCDSFHHELDELPSGDVADFIALSHDLRVYPNYPSSELDPTITQPSANVIGDEIVEFRRDGTLVRRRSLFDVIDPYRICYGSLAAVQSSVYGVTGYDWTHGNAAELDPHDGTLLVSLRHQDAVVKMMRTSGALRWILGPHERWVAPWSALLLAPIGSPFEWQFHQHSPHAIGGSEFVLYDNGNYRVIPPAPWGPTDLFYSRAVRFRVDSVARTVQQTWEHDGGMESFFSPLFCDADPLQSTGNVLITDGHRRVAPTVNRNYARLVEVTSAATSEKVFELIVNDPALPATSPYNWSIYRSDRCPSFYP